jgi:hypothetical protein
MKQYLDYERLLQDDVRASVYHFLVTVFGKDEEREAKAGFPRFFSDEPAVKTVNIHLTALAKRAVEIRHYEDDRREILRLTCEWFGIELLEYAGNAGNDNEKFSSEISLPPDFTIARDESYNGLTDSPWIINNVQGKNGELTHVLVLDIQIVEEKMRPGMGNTTFFLIGIPVEMIDFGDAPNDQTDEERFG